MKNVINDKWKSKSCSIHDVFNASINLMKSVEQYELWFCRMKFFVPLILYVDQNNFNLFLDMVFEFL